MLSAPINPAGAGLRNAWQSREGPAMTDLPTTFADRAALAAFVAETFAAYAEGEAPSATVAGGRHAAEPLLEAIDPVRYARTRNQLDGAVTRLSPYLRHGIVTLAEVRDLAVGKSGERAAKLVNELGWRDYYQRVYAKLGERVWQDQEAYKTGLDAADYAADLPAEVERGETGLACIDAFATELARTGYLHNHARMYVAAYVVHWLKVRWQAGAAWFLRHLLDGDPASNNLSWQWVASTFSHKPYIFNRANLERATHGRYCERCARAADCPFAGSYEELAARLFRLEERAA
jgi:deoxyribodipyrimidine photo-lyase